MRNKILSSTNFSKYYRPGTGNFSGCTIYQFDDFTVEKCHNGRQNHHVYTRGVQVAEIDRDEFDKIIKEREAKTKQDFFKE